MKLTDYKQMKKSKVYKVSDTYLHVKLTSEGLMKSTDSRKITDMTKWTWSKFTIDCGQDFQSYQSAKGYNLIEVKK